MTREEIMALDIEQIEERSKQLVEELDAAETNEAMDLIQDELEAIEERRNAINKEIEERKNEIAEVIEGKGEVIEEIEERNEKEMFGIETKEYRDAFMANLVGKATVEQRAILADNSAYGDGLSLPVGLDKEIWDQVNEAHPILADVERLNTGIAIKVTQMTPTGISKKMDKTSSTEQSISGVDVTLVGADYHTYIAISYAEAKMSQGAMERFLVKEIADAIGEALAKDVFASIVTGAGSDQAVEGTADMFADVKAALALATKANNPVIYAPAAAYYEIVGAIKSGSPFNIGTTLGCEVKKDNAAECVVVVDPSLYVLNVIHDTLVESERDAKNAQFIIGGYMRAEGCLRKTAAAAYIEAESES